MSMTSGSGRTLTASAATTAARTEPRAAMSQGMDDRSRVSGSQGCRSDGVGHVVEASARGEQGGLARRLAALSVLGHEAVELGLGGHGGLDEVHPALGAGGEVDHSDLAADALGDENALPGGEPVARERARDRPAHPSGRCGQGWGRR